MRSSPHFRHAGFPFLAASVLLFWAGVMGGNGSLWANASSDGKTSAEYVISVHPDRPSGMYHQGEPVTFQIQLKHHEADASEGAVVWKISKDEVAPIQTGTVTINAGKASVTGKLDEPGILHCEVSFNHDSAKISALAGAAVDPLELKPSLPVPDDFDAFWAQKKKELAAVPMNVKLTPVDVPAELRGAEVFEYQADSIGAPSVGYYGRPAGAKPKSLPAVLFVPGAGVRSSNKTAVAEWANRGMLTIDLNAHGIPDGQPAEFYTALEKGELKDYRTRGRESRETYYFLNVYFRVLRALDFLAAQPEWDGRTLVICGGSQGGALSLVGGALDPRVTYVIANIPALSDHSGMLAGRVAGWPKAVSVGADGKPDEKVLQTMRYFDSANFATRIKVPVHMEVCFLDVICPATGAYVDYNNLRVKKELVTHPDRGHDIGPQIWGDIERLVAAHVAEQRGSK